jgi:hypothetical protein
MEKKGYIVLEIGWEYNDEYYSTGNYGEMYEAPSEIFIDKDKAKAEWLKKEIASLKGVNLMNYIGEQDLTDYLTTDEETFEKFLKDTWNLELDDYEIEIPQKAKDEDIIKLIGLISLRFFKLHEITITK